MTLWLGIMRVAEAAGLVALIGRCSVPSCAGCFPTFQPNIPPLGPWSSPSPPICSA